MTRSSWPVALDEDVLVGVDQDVADRGSRSSGSSGPRPNTSSSTSAKSVSRSPRLSGVASSASSWPSSVRISPSARARSAWASASRFRRFSSLRCTLARSSRYCCAGRLVRPPRPQVRTSALSAGGARERAVPWLGYQMDARRWRPSGRWPRLTDGSAPRPRSGRGCAGEAVELRRDLGVAAERQRHARVERRTTPSCSRSGRCGESGARARSRSAPAESGTARPPGSAGSARARRTSRAGRCDRAAAARCGPTARRGWRPGTIVSAV